MKSPVVQEVDPETSFASLPLELEKAAATGIDVLLFHGLYIPVRGALRNRAMSANSAANAEFALHLFCSLPEGSPEGLKARQEMMRYAVTCPL